MRTNRLRIYPTYAQINMLYPTLDLCRDLYSAMLVQRTYDCRSGEKVNYNSLQEEIPDMKRTFP